jgi:hypothetical protein
MWNCIHSEEAAKSELSTATPSLGLLLSRVLKIGYERTDHMRETRMIVPGSGLLQLVMVTLIFIFDSN